MPVQKSGNLLKAPRVCVCVCVYIYIYIYIYIYTHTHTCNTENTYKAGLESDAVISVVDGCFKPRGTKHCNTSGRSM